MTPHEIAQEVNATGGIIMEGPAPIDIARGEGFAARSW